MDKKKKLIQLTEEGMLLCCVIVVMTLLCIGIIKKEVKNTKRKLTETTWWYRIQDNKKVQVDLNQKIKADSQGKLVLYNDTIAHPGAQSQEEKDPGEEENVLPAFVKGESGPHVPDLYEKWTQPPRPYTYHIGGYKVRLTDGGNKNVGATCNLCLLYTSRCV